VSSPPRCDHHLIGGDLLVIQDPPGDLAESDSSAPELWGPHGLEENRGYLASSRQYDNALFRLKKHQVSEFRQRLFRCRQRYRFWPLTEKSPSNLRTIRRSQSTVVHSDSRLESIRVTLNNSIPFPKKSDCSI